MRFEEYLKKYGVKDPDDPRHFYDYKAAFEAGVVPDLWDTLPEEDRNDDLEQAMSGQRTGFPMSRTAAEAFYSGSYMWPDEFKREGHPIPAK